MTIQNILMKYEATPENLLRVVKDVQKEFGAIDKILIDKIAKYFSMKPAAVFSVASFYDQINTDGKFSITIKVCDGANCNTKKSTRLLNEIERFFGQKAGDSFNCKVKIERESCFGFCAQGPVMVVNEVMYEKVTPERVDDILRGYTDFK
jgi:NADH-quinone oxidoreductase subunit E